jgi:hypothetical protein
MASKFPDDERNAAAADLLDQLIPTVAAVPSVLLLQFDQVLDDQPTDEAINSWTRAIGFRVHPANAQAFVEMVIAAPSKFVKR